MKTALLAMGVLSLSACDPTMYHGGEMQHDSQSIELDKSEMVRAQIKLGAGELEVDGGAQKLMEGNFNYNVPAFKPVIRYDASSFRGQLTIEQKGGVHGGSHVDCKWNIKLNDKVPMDVMAELGAGEARLNLGTLNLRSVEVNMGVGEARVDLHGKPSRDYNVKVSGGVGHAMVFLPNDVGISATAHGGIGDIAVRGLEKRGGTWINPAHENAPVTIHIEVNGGIGQIEIIAN